MIRAPFEVTSKRGSFRVMVRAASMRRAEEDLRARYPGDEVRLILPLDGEEFFADSDNANSLETECIVVRSAQDPASATA